MSGLLVHARRLSGLIGESPYTMQEELDERHENRELAATESELIDFLVRQSPAQTRPLRAWTVRRPRPSFGSGAWGPGALSGSAPDTGRNGS